MIVLLLLEIMTKEIMEVAIDRFKYTKGGSEIGPVDPFDWYAYIIKTRLF